MKSRRSTYVIMLLVGLLAAYLIIFYGSAGNSHPKVNWTETYKRNSTQPYGTHVIVSLLKKYYPHYGFFDVNKPLKESLDTAHIEEPADYVFIGDEMFADSDDIDHLMQFIARGNQAFIACNDIPQELMKRVYHNECDSLDHPDDSVADAFLSVVPLRWYGMNSMKDSVISMNFYNENLADSNAYKFRFSINNKPVNYNWQFINGSYFCDSLKSFTHLGYLDSGYVNFVKITYGKGALFIHTSPIAFTNYSLLHKHNLTYADKVFSHLHPGNIYWDNFSEMNSYGNSESKSPLIFILSQRSLRWAWYLLLLLVLLFMIFRGKRRQRIIPVLESNINTSLEFIQTISRLYFQQHDHRKLCLQKMKLFLAFIRNRYYLSTNTLDDNLAAKLAIKSQIDVQTIKHIFTQYQWIDKATVSLTEQDLTDFYTLIENFYKNCR